MANRCKMCLEVVIRNNWGGRKAFFSVRSETGRRGCRISKGYTDWVCWIRDRQSEGDRAELGLFPGSWPQILNWVRPFSWGILPRGSNVV